MPTFSENTETESTRLPTIIQAGEPTVRDELVGSLQTRLDRSEDDRLQERFLWFGFSGFLFDLVAFMAAGVTAGVLFFVVLLAALIVLSKQWRFEGLWEALVAVKALFKDHNLPLK